MKTRINDSRISGKYVIKTDSAEYYFDYEPKMGVYNLSIYVEMPDLYENIPAIVKLRIEDSYYKDKLINLIGISVEELIEDQKSNDMVYKKLYGSF